MIGEAEAGQEVAESTKAGEGRDAPEGATTTDVTAEPSEPQTFDDMGLRPEVRQALTEMGFSEPMPVQRAVFGRMVSGRDVLVQSRTGSGKTAAFGIPLAHELLDPAIPQVQALSLAPTRELALQVAIECGKISAYRGLQVVPVYGGAPMGKQIDQLKAGAHMVAGTPGRVLDHLRRGTLKLDALRVLILDEADEMLSMGFLEEITEIIKRCPKDRQTVLFSATIPDDIERIATRYMRSPEKVQLSADFVGVQEITHSYYMVSGMGRARDLVRILEVERPDSAVIFCNTREDTGLVAEHLRKNGLDAEAISSDLTQKDRERVMGRMKEKKLHYLVATDIAARGIDISDLSHVINYTFPESAEVYVHRTGRTGRAGKSGTAISLISPRELGNFYMLKLTYKIRPEERELPSSEQARTSREALRVDELRTKIGSREVAPEWRSLARRVWSSDDGERMLAALIEERLTRPATPVQPARPELSAAPRPLTAPPSPATAATPVPSPAAAATPASSAEAAAPAPTSGEVAEPEEAAPSGKRTRRGRGQERGGRDRSTRGRGGAREGAGSARGEGSAARPPQSERPAARPAAAKPASSSDTIDDSDGREFWEAWADSKAEPASPPEQAPALTEVAESPAPRRARRERAPRAPEPLDPGMARLYLNLGRRDGLEDPEIEQLLKDRDVTVDQVQVRNSHTYLILEDGRADAVVDALHGTRVGEREVVCERARR